MAARLTEPNTGPIRYQLMRNNIHDSWATIMFKLSNHYRITTSAQRKNGKNIHIRKSMRANPEQLKIYQTCNISSFPLQSTRTEY